MLTTTELRRYPLRQALTPAAIGVASSELVERVDRLSQPDSYLVVREPQGGRIYAANERAFFEARRSVVAQHGSDVLRGLPEVHTFRESAHDPLLEPVMYLRVKVPIGYAEMMTQDLEQRGGRLLQQDVHRLDVVIRAEVFLRDLLGYEAHLLTLTNGTAVVWNWLQRYAVAQQFTLAAAAPQRRSTWLDLLGWHPQAATCPLFGVLLGSPVVANNERS